MSFIISSFLFLTFLFVNVPLTYIYRTQTQQQQQQSQQQQPRRDPLLADPPSHHPSYPRAPSYDPLRVPGSGRAYEFILVLILLFLY